MEGVEGRGPAGEREDSLHFDLKRKRSRHNNFRSSIFSTPTKERSTSFSRGFAAAAAGAPSFLAGMSGGQGNRSGGDARLAEGRNADPEAVRAAMALDASCRSNSRERDGSGSGSGGGGGGGGAGGVGKAAGAGGDEGGTGGGNPGTDGGGGDGGAHPPNQHKGRHWSSAAAACVLSGQPPSPKAAAAVAARRAADAGGGEGGHRRNNGSGVGGSGGGIFSRGGGTAAVIPVSIASSGNDGGVVDGRTAVGDAEQGVAAAATTAVATAAAAAAAPAENERKGPRPKSVWERGGAAPAPKTAWKQLIARNSHVGTRSSRWNRGAGDSGGVQGGVPGGGGGERKALWRVRDLSACIQCRGGCLSCCRGSGDGGRSGRSGGGGGGGRDPADTNQDRRRRRPRNPPPSSRNGLNGDSPSRGGGGSGIKAAGVFLGVGLLLEVAATLWAFRQAARAGALAGGAVDGTAGVAVAALAVALTGQAVEAAAGVACVKNPSRSGAAAAALLAGAAAVQGLGVVAVAAVLTSLLPSFASAADSAADSADSTDTSTAHEAWLPWAAAAVTVAGALLEAIPAAFDRAAEKLPFLGAFGHALLWLGVAALEVLVALLLVREGGGGSAAAAAAVPGQGESLAEVLEDGEMIGLVVVEAAAMLALWAARGLWTRARLLLAVKGQEGPSRRRSTLFTRFDSV